GRQTLASSFAAGCLRCTATRGDCWHGRLLSPSRGCATSWSMEPSSQWRPRSFRNLRGDLSGRRRPNRRWKWTAASFVARLRMSRYLDQPFTPRSDLLEQVREYQRGGAFADLAMLQLRRALASSAHYHVESGKVLAACRERRDRENRHFAESLANGYEAALHQE